MARLRSQPQETTLRTVRFGMPRATQGVQPQSGLKGGGRFFSGVRAEARPADI